MQKKSSIVQFLLKDIGRLLSSAGFESKAKALLWYRDTGSQLDVVEVSFADMKGYVPPGLSPQSFRLEVGSFFKFVPHPGGAKFRGISGCSVDGAASCHLRLQLDIARWRNGARESDFWYVDPLGMLQNGAIANAIKLIGSVVLDWFSDISNKQAVFDRLHAGQTSRNFRGRHLEAVRNPDLVAGFLALELGQWQECTEHLLRVANMKNPAAVIDEHQPELLYASILPEIEVAVQTARLKQRLSKNSMG